MHNSFHLIGRLLAATNLAVCSNLDQHPRLRVCIGEHIFVLFRLRPWPQKGVADLSKIGSNEIIGTSTAANIDPRCGSTYQITVGIERVQQARLIGAGIRLNSPQRISVDEERRLYSAVVSPKSHGMPRVVVRTAMVWKVNH